MMACGSRNQTSYSDVIHWGMVPSGTSSPLYRSEKLCQATSPNGVKSIVLYKSVWLANGGDSLCFKSVDAQRSSNILMFGADIWVRQYRNWAVSNSIRSLYGDQSSVCWSVCRGGGCAFRGKLSPSSLQGWPNIPHHQLEYWWTRNHNCILRTVNQRMNDYFILQRRLIAFW